MGEVLMKETSQFLKKVGDSEKRLKKRWGVS